MKICLK
jgi:serine protease Do